tara:strand:+ start:132 stop:329 length:198 start_codon:yes stop_codon:yes gene_type:complete
MNIAIKIIMHIIITLLITISIVTPVLADNQEIQSFSKAKKTLEKQVYNKYRTTLYCGASFDAKNK